MTGMDSIAIRKFPTGVKTMSVDLATVKRVARLARIAVSEEEANKMLGQLNGILGFVEQLSEVNTDGVEPMTSVTPVEMKKRTDAVTDGDKADDIVANAPATDRNFFQVPKVVE
jgi:aspartyl-tRNA(Asn)/glutamyl-tRNA(Gln) amidotransferase subunit C